MIIDETLIPSIISLLNNAGLCSAIEAVTHCPGGNNRTYKVMTKEGSFAVKQYFRQAEDMRDRLAAEFAFLSYAKQVAPQFIPAPYAKDSANAIALYEFIEGQPIRPDNITEADITEAIQFFCALNETTSRIKASELELAAEACFTLQAHLDLIETRLHALQNINPHSKEDELAKKLIDNLCAYWSIMTNKTKQLASENNQLTSILHASQRCISPSDFGFHNALRAADGSIRFLDFEYAGWDDPAKMVGDFFSQLAVPVPEKFFQSFTRQVMQPFPSPEHLIQRATCLRVIYQIKWCCIILNIFLPIHLERRQFANPTLNVVDLKKAQLAKATSLLQRLEHQHDLH